MRAPLVAVLALLACAIAPVSAAAMTSTGTGSECKTADGAEGTWKTFNGTLVCVAPEISSGPLVGNEVVTIVDKLEKKVRNQGVVDWCKRAPVACGGRGSRGAGGDRLGFEPDFKVDYGDRAVAKAMCIKATLDWEGRDGKKASWLDADKRCNEPKKEKRLTADECWKLRRQYLNPEFGLSDRRHSRVANITLGGLHRHRARLVELKDVYGVMLDRGTQWPRSPHSDGDARMDNLRMFKAEIELLTEDIPKAEELLRKLGEGGCPR